MKICTEADYLQAHLTFIAGESGRRNPAFRNLKKWLRSVLKKWITVAKGPKHNVDAGKCRRVAEQGCLYALLSKRSSGSKNLFPSFGTLQGDAIDSSHSNTQSSGDPLPPDSLRSKRSNPLRVQNRSRTLSLPKTQLAAH